MSPIRVPVLLVLLVLAGKVKGVQKVRINAAMKFEINEIMLVSGKDLVFLTDEEESSTGVISDIEVVPWSFDVLAAAYDYLERRELYYGKDSFYDYDVHSVEYQHRNYTEDLQEFFGNEGPDAVAMKDGKLFYFKGCKLATYDRSGNLKQRKTKKFGLPCNPDAAWSNEDLDAIIFLRGDQIWIWYGREYIEGPMPFRSKYTLTSWELIPDSDEK